MARQHGISKPADWKRVTARHFEKAGGKGLLQHYGGSVFGALKDLCDPDGNLDVQDCRASMPKGYWDSEKNQRGFLEKLAASKGVKEAADWRKVSYNDVLEHGGRRLLAKHGDSLLLALQAAWPEAGVQPEHMATLPRNYWASAERRRQFLDSLAEEFGVQQPEDWQRVGEELTRRGSSLLRYYGSVAAMIKDSTVGSLVDATAQGVLKVRRRVPASFWETEDNVAKFVRAAADQLGVKEVHDWYRVSHKQLEALQGAGLLRKMSLVEALQIAYPGEEWDDEQLRARTKKTSQRSLRVAVSQLFAQGTALEQGM